MFEIDYQPRRAYIRLFDIFIKFTNFAYRKKYD